MGIYRQQFYLRLQTSRQLLFIEAVRRRKKAARKRAAQNYTPHSAQHQVNNHVNRTSRLLAGVLDCSVGHHADDLGPGLFPSSCARDSPT